MELAQGWGPGMKPFALTRIDLLHGSLAVSIPIKGARNKIYLSQAAI